MLSRTLFDEPGFAYDAAEEARDGTLIQWTWIGMARALDHLALARAVAERQARDPLRFADLDGEQRSLVEEAK
jgi:hypothetical protein